MSQGKEWPREPAEAWKNDPVNPSANMAGKALVFIRPAGGFGVGHVGWGYLDDRDHVPKDGASATLVAVDKWLVGSVDNPLHRPYTPAIRQGYWETEYTGEPLEFMRAHRYEYYKMVPVDRADTDAALAEAEKVGHHPYELIGANCEDAVYKVLREYGARLPSPRDIRDWEPNRWFRRIPGQPYSIDDDTGLRQDISGIVQPAGVQGRNWAAIMLLLMAGAAGALWVRSRILEKRR